MRIEAQSRIRGEDTRLVDDVERGSWCVLEKRGFQ